MNEYRILVVDDEEDLCEILKFNLENEGYEVDTANSAEDALKMDISTYDLLLLDVMTERKLPSPKKSLKYCSCYCKTKDAYFPAKTY